MTRRLAWALVVTLTACTDDSGDPDDDAADDAAGSDGDEVPGEASATIALNGVTYEFAFVDFPAERCEPDVFGVFQVVMYSEDQSARVDIELPGETDGTPRFRLNVESGDWVADETDEWPAVTPGDSEVADYTIDGRSASGSGTAINDDDAFGDDPAEPVDFSFDVVCPE